VQGRLPIHRRVSADDTACLVKGPRAGPGLPSRSGRPLFHFPYFLTRCRMNTVAIGSCLQ